MTHGWSAIGGRGCGASFGVTDRHPAVVSDGRCVAIAKGLRFLSSAMVERRCIRGDIARAAPRRVLPPR